MDHGTGPSCWGVMTWTVAALGGVLGLVHLLGGFTAVEIAMR